MPPQKIFGICILQEEVRLDESRSSLVIRSDVIFGLMCAKTLVMMLNSEWWDTIPSDCCMQHFDQIKV